MIFDPGLGSGGGGKPELLFKSTSKVESVDLTGIDWDAWSCVWILIKDGGDNYNANTFVGFFDVNTESTTYPIGLSDASNYVGNVFGSVAVYPHIGGDNPLVWAIASSGRGAISVFSGALSKPCSELKKFYVSANTGNRKAKIEIWGQP